MLDLSEELVRATAVALRDVYWSRLGVVRDECDALLPLESSEWDREARAAVAAVLGVVVERAERRDHLWLSRPSLAAIAAALDPAPDPDGGDRGRRDPCSPRVAPPTLGGA